MKNGRFAAFRGVGVALVTPFENGHIDRKGMERLVSHVIEGGVDFLVALGTTGESNTASEAEHRQILDTVIQANAGRLPVVAGNFGGNNTAALVHKIKGYNFDGIDALLSSAPAYNRPTQEGLYCHYMALAEASPRPIILYNVPSRTACNIAPETTLRLAQSSDRFLGIKEAASNDMMQIMRIIKDAPDHFLTLSGDDFITLPLIASGGSGVISVIANAFPREFAAMTHAALNGDWDEARRLHYLLLEMYYLLFIEGNPAGVKAALAHLGICGDEVRLPLVSMSQAGKERLFAGIAEILRARQDLTG
mgnify:CR=1 FL=1